MKGKVKCTCGWSWNKSDSSAKDMYICHECGRDNSNNMKNGGDISQAQVGKKIKIKDERLEGQVTKDNLEDRNVFSQNQSSFKKPVVQKEIKRTQKEAANPKVVIFAESPEIKKYKWNEVKDADEFYDPNLNPTIGRDSTFIKEAQNVKDFYERTDPNVKVNIVPLYGDKKVMQEKLKRMTPFDKFAIFGHFGDRLAGIPNSEIAKYLSDSRVNDCYFGSCGFENEINKSALKNLSGKTLNYRPSDNYWWGFDPNAKTFDEGMWSRTGEQADAVKIIPIKEGVTHKIKKSKDGGWLENYNDSQASAPEGMVGDGFSNVGRDYSPAWGGQFQEGGKLTFLQPTSDKLPQGYRIPYSDPSSERAMSIGGENGEPAYLIPSFKYGKPLADPIAEFRKTREHLGGPFKTWQEAEKWEKETRHPAVEKGENIMFPQEQFQMGGKLKSNIPVIEDAGGYNEEGYWVPDWEAMTAQAKKLGAKRVKTKHGSLIVFDDNWEVIGVDDNPDAMQMGGNVYPVNYVPQAQEGKKTYSYPLRDKLYSGEDEYFKANPHVGGMAAEDNQVIINPYSPLSDEEKNAIRMNETARLAMRNGYARPTFELTPEQQESFKNYSTDEQDQRETIIGRILSGDPSAKNVTPEQKKYAEELQKVLKFQTGGSIPGAVGFTYARTKGIPSEGPYAKKTMASAQNGEKLNPFTYPKPDYQYSTNPFLVRDPQYGIFIAGLNPTYSTDDFSIGASMVGVGNEHFQKVPADYGIRGSYNPTDSLSINANISKDNVGAGLSYRFQNGGEMRYYQNGLDWKPKGMKDGGWLDGYDKAQDGYTTGNKVTYGTPEYTEAYNKGEVVTDEGVRSPIALDEVVIENNYRRPRGVWEQYADKIVEENKDAGLLGAIIGTPISAITSVPQLMAMKALTGEMQRPSEAMDIENPYGAMAVDAFLDPANAIGVGILTKENALARLSNLKNINAEGKIFSGMNNELNNMAIQNTERYMAKRTPTTSTLSSEMEPYVSRYTKLSDEPYIPYQEDEYMKWFNEQKAKMNPSTPVQDPRSILRSSSVIDINDLPNNNFKSEIDWGKWNSEIPDNPQLMKEYNAIEQTTKANGSWMKNPDGSAFQGTPEQFVQQNSKNFKKAFGNSKLINPDGSPTKLYHGTQSKLINDEFNLDYFGKTDPGFMGRGVYLSGHKGISHHYAYPTKAERINGTLQVKDYLPGEAEKLFPNSEIYEVYGNVQNPINLSEINTNDLYKRFNRLDVEDNLSQYDAAIHDFKRKDGLIQEINIADPKNIKSATGNNGMFDMTNPNIYKSVLPIGLGLGAASQIKEEEPLPGMRQGGIIKDDLGQWAHPGEITEISGDTMATHGYGDIPLYVVPDKGKPRMVQPNTGIQKFPGAKKFTEYPMAKNGLRQEQKGLVNLDNLLNFTNYNKPQPGGWLSKYE